VRAGKEERVRRYIANADYARDERRSFAAQVFTSAAEALRRAARDPRPFALVVDAYEPHEPWTPPRKYTDLLGDPGYRGPEPAMPAYDRVEAWLTPDEADVVLERLRVLYAAEVAMTDRWLGVLLERLHDLRLDRDTIVALISDHGVQLGEHGWTGKIASALHPELIQVPFVIVDPRIRPTSIRSDYFASTHDLAPTVLSMAGARGQFQTDGSDLSTIFHGVEPPSRPEAYGGYSDHHFLRSGRWAYTCDNRLERPRLYDLSGDAGELLDVAAEQPDVVEELGELIRERIGGAIPDYS
jgi:arylsulfatase A-like enzyme